MLALAFGFNVLILLVLILHKEPAIPQGKLADGTVLRIEKLTYGTNHVFAKGSPITAKLRQALPGPLRGMFGSPKTASTSTEKPELVIWFAQVNPSTQETVSSTVNQLQVTDLHGCVFPAGNRGTSGNYPNFSMNYARVPVFPRRQETFLFSASGSPGGNPVQISLPNPFRADPHTWTPEPFPIHRQVGEFEFVCTEVQGRFFPAGAYFEPHFQVFQNGQDRTEWYKHEVIYADETGNRGPKLCPYEPAWKVEVNFFKNYQATFPESSIARMSDARVPTPGQVVQRDVTCSIGNINIRFLALCGPGDYKFSNEVCVAAASWQETWTETSGSSSSYNGNQRLVELEFRKKKFSLILDMKGLTRNQEMLIRARDQTGKFHPASFNLSSEDIYRYELDLPQGLQKVDLEFIPQKPAHVEFIVKPPGKQ
ncbi:MAG: hypothetical protein JWM16_3089 [Verrucomicrobiales bacterium]|nr:hypothetical protein [Verrucomicrobiales bacterium]